MKKIYHNLPVLMMLVMTVTSHGQPAASVSKPGPIRSVFTMPTNVREGRDPFYPESPRVFQSAESTSHTIELSQLAVKGYYRDAKGALVIINNHSFGVGDEGDVLTTGGRIHIRCLEIHPTFVVIDINGQRRELSIQSE